MASPKKTKTSKPMYKFEEEPYASMIRKTREMADHALSSYGEPTMSIEELQKLIATELPDISLTEVILREREAAW